ncbi:hypothetical protein Tcan_03836 [Toxocara canis]|uniref:Uncharacterized protein n=1 Tax=Toxocara canis TaxID=6265 RepID=A0A0B2VEI6_TOXCA|nr:hypothetical protein Tcan_03836 [Toxocara canis]
MLHAKLDELKKNEPVAISVITPDDTPEQEVMELSRMSGLGAVPPSASSQIENKVEELRRELAEQQRRNNELRQSNYRIVETAQKQDQVYAKRLAELEKKCEQNVHDNRNIAITAIRTALPSGVKLASLPQSCTDQQYKQWITDAAETLKKSAETKATVSNAGKHEPLPKVAVAATDSAAKIKELEEKVKRYRSALATVSSSIDTIEHEAAQKEKNYEREIAQLKKEIFHSRVLSDKAHRLKEKNITLDKRVNDLMRQLKRERGNGEQLNGQAAELRELLGTNIGDAESATAPFIRRHRSGRRHRKDSSGYNNEAGGESRRRKKCLSESAAHVTFLMAGEDRDPSSGRKSVEDEWEVPLPKVAVAATDSAAKIKELEEKVKRYRSALATVSSSIDTIEHEAAQKEKNYEREIAQLKKEIFHSRVLSDKAHRLKEKNITLDKRVNDLMRQLKRERGNGEQLNGQAAELRELLGTNIGDAESATAPFIRRHRSGRRHRKDSSGYNNEAGGESRRRKKCLSESAAHVTFLMAGEDRDPSSGRKSVEDEWEVVE